MNTHGRNSTYNTGCRCTQCTRAHAERQRDYMRRNPEQRSKKHRRTWEARHPDGEPVYVLLDFPVAIVNRRVFPNDEAAISRLSDLDP